MSKDNPVPSLDPMTIINDLILVNKQSHIPRQYVRMRLNQLISSIKKQNGVETNKVQPGCSCSEPHYGFKSVEVCTDCNGIKDDEFWKKLG
jgi:hypothetical protein